MLHGKKGFERVVWACKHVLIDSVSWLFYDFEKPSDSSGTAVPLDKHQPIHQAIAPAITQIKSAKIPSFATSHVKHDDEEWSTEIHEWLSLVALHSPRIKATDNIDPYLCRYSVPSYAVSKVHDLVSVKWSGLLPAIWIRRLFVELW